MKPVTLKILFQEFSAEPEAASNQITGMQPENDSLEVHLPLTSFNTSGEFTFFFLAWAWFRRCARLACSALRQDSKNYFSHAAARIIEADEGHVSSKLWAAIRHRLPGKQKRSSGFSPLACERLDDQWHPHFDALELGEATTPGSLLEACHARQQNAPKLLPLRDELPTIMDVEAALRRVSPNKKGGDDQVLGGVLHWAAPAIAQEVTCLFVKIIGAQAEPLAFKGGRLAPIHKRGSRLDAANYRGVLLLPSLSKVLHSLLRKQTHGST